MADITPTYDFGHLATPTRDTLIEQALSLTVSALGFSDLAANVLTILAGADSGVSGEALVLGDPTAQMWVNASGDVWVMEAAGPVRLYRHQLGWESRRFWVEEDSGWGGDSPAQPGVGLQTGPNGESEAFERAQGDTTSTSSRVKIEIIEQSLNDNQQGRNHGLLSETGDSGYRLWNGRGGHVFYHVDLLSSATFNYDRDIKNNFRMVTANGTPGPVTWQSYYLSAAFTANITRFQGYVTTPMSGTSTATDGSFGTLGFRNKVLLHGWNFGIPKFGNLESGGANP